MIKRKGEKRKNELYKRERRNICLKRNNFYLILISMLFLFNYIDITVINLTKKF